MIVIAVVNAIAQDAKKGCNPKACKPGNTKVEEAEVITNLRTKVIELSKLAQLRDINQEELIGKNEEESLMLISIEVSYLASLLNVTDYRVSGSGAVLVNQLSDYVDKLLIQTRKN